MEGSEKAGWSREEKEEGGKRGGEGEGRGGGDGGGWGGERGGGKGGGEEVHSFHNSSMTFSSVCHLSSQ